MNVSYPVMAILALVAIAVVAVLGIYRGQKSRTIA
jgi:hypothetical protein